MWVDLFLIKTRTPETLANRAFQKRAEILSECRVTKKRRHLHGVFSFWLTTDEDLKRFVCDRCQWQIEGAIRTAERSKFVGAPSRNKFWEPLVGWSFPFWHRCLVRMIIWENSPVDCSIVERKIPSARLPKQARIWYNNLATIQFLR